MIRFAIIKYTTKSDKKIRVTHWLTDWMTDLQIILCSVRSQLFMSAESDSDFSLQLQKHLKLSINNSIYFIQLKISSIMIHLYFWPNRNTIIIHLYFWPNRNTPITKQLKCSFTIIKIKAWIGFDLPNQFWWFFLH